MIYIRNLCRRRKVDFISVIVITLAFAGVISAVMIFKGEGVWGSVTDWQNQHFAIPEYLRTRFYDTGELLPEFAPHLGGGQNIYTLSYYGLMSPVFLPAYLMPHISMADYIQVCSLALVFISCLLMYRLAKNHFEGYIPLFLTLLFMFAAPLIFHSHRHIMFISYMPFLLTAMLAASSEDSAGSRLLLIISSFCILCTSFYFSISAFAVILIYSVYALLKRYSGLSVRRIASYMMPKVICLFLGGLMAGVLWVPTFFTLIGGRENGSSFVNIMKLLIPTINLNYAMYSTYSIGLTSIIAAAVIVLTGSDNRAERFCARIFAVLICLPLIVYLCNASMYIDSKVLIPFLPLAVLLCGDMTVRLLDGKVKMITFTIAFSIVIALDMIFNYREPDINIAMAADGILLIVSCILLTKKNKRKFYFISTAAFAAAVCLTVNFSEKFVSRETVDEIYSDDVQLLADEAVASDYSFYRFAGLSDSFETVNMIYGEEFYSAGIYSSVSSGDYRDFRFHTSASGNSQSCNARQTNPHSVIFDVLMGCRYRISNDDKAMFGETVESSSGGKYLLRNENSLPVGYACSDTVSEGELKELSSAERCEVMLRSIIVPDGGNCEPESFSVSEFDSSYTVTGDTSAISMINEAYEIKSDTPFTVTAKLDVPIADKVIFVSCRADNRIGRKQDRSKVSMSINGVKNTLSDPDWKYHNGNYDFSFVISSADPIDELVFDFSAGNYIISDFNISLLDGAVLTDACANKDSFIIDRDSMGGDTIEGRISVTSDGWFNLSVPYGKGFEILVDGVPTEYSKTNTAFIGFPISSGEHSIIINYHAPMRKLGLFMSITGGSAAAVMLALMYFFEHRKGYAAVTAKKGIII